VRERGREGGGGKGQVCMKEMGCGKGGRKRTGEREKERSGESESASESRE